MYQNREDVNPESDKMDKLMARETYAVNLLKNKFYVNFEYEIKFYMRDKNEKPCYCLVSVFSTVKGEEFAVLASERCTNELKEEELKIADRLFMKGVKSVFRVDTFDESNPTPFFRKMTNEFPSLTGISAEEVK